MKTAVNKLEQIPSLYMQVADLLLTILITLDLNVEPWPSRHT